MEAMSLSTPDVPGLAGFLSRKAGNDAKAVRLLAPSEEIDDQAVGYHAQQATEKWIKAVMVSRRLPEERTHDLGRLLEVLAAAKIEPPPGADRLDFLTEFEVQQRSDELLAVEPLDRDAVVTLVAEVGDWASRLIGA
jgi:HEPN domain-containing protein